jgi:hypothetical protein
MKRAPWLCLLLFIVSVTHSQGQSHSVSLGVYTGITSTYVWDEGINSDPRYETRYDVKFAPIGIDYGIDYEGFGFVVSPGLMNIGQKYNVINTLGGQEGIRKGKLSYLNLPIAVKVHVIDL